MLAMLLLYAVGSLFLLLFVALLAVTVYIYLVHRRYAHIPSPKMPRESTRLKMSHDMLNGPPKLRAVTAFPTGHGKVNIPQVIGVKYQVFGAQLLDDPTGAKVNNMEHKHRGDSLRINTEILQEWLRGRERRPVSWRTLIEVLQDIELGALAGDIEESCSADVMDTEPSFPLRKIHQQPTLTSWQNVSIAILVATISLLVLLAIEYWPKKPLNGYVEPEKPLNGYMNVLKATYQKQPVTDPDHWLHVVMPFINLTLTERDTPPVKGHLEYQMQGKNKLSLDEVVNSIKEGFKILIEGRPGVGKTTLLRQITKLWAEQKNFPLVVLVLLGHTPSSRIRNLESMLEYHSHGYPDTASVARELGLTGGKGICFLLDALDEYLPQEGDFIYQLIKGQTLPNAAMMVTSRPSASYHLQQHFKRKIEVVGFSKRQIQQYISALPFNNNVSEYLHRHTNVERISYLPLHLAMVTYLALHSEQVSLLDLDTDTKLYHMFVNLTFRHRYKDVDNLDEIHNQAFNTLSEIAFDATARSDDYGASLRLDNLDPELKTKLESFSIVSINKQHEGDTVHNTFTFSHYTFQEFFAAYYLTTLPHEEQMEALELYQHSSLLMWRFFFGLLRAHTSETTTNLKLFEKFAHIHISTAWLEKHTTIMICAYELKQTDIAQVLVQVLNYSITLEVQDPSECAASAYVISLNPHQFRRLEIELNYFAQDYQEACFDSMLAELPKNNGVAHVTLCELSLSDGTVSAMVKLLKYFPYLQKLELFRLYTIPGVPLTIAKELEELKRVRHVAIRIERMPINATILTEVLTHLPHLEHLSLDVDVKEIGTLLERMINLQLLDLSHNFIGDDGAVALAKRLQNKVNLRYLALEAEGLKNAASLQTLKLGRNPIGDEEVAALAEGIKHLTSLQVLELEYTDIGDNGVAALAEGIKHLTSLQTLNLGGNRIGDEGVAALAEGIKHLSSLQTLNLGGNTIGDDGAAALAEGIEHLNSLQTLNLGGNRIGDDGAAALAEGIKHLTSLQTLDPADNRTGVVALRKCLKNSTSLKELILSLSKIGDMHASKLTEGTEHLTSLQTLNPADNKTGVVALRKGLKSSTTLKELILSLNVIGNMGAAKLAEGIKNLALLQVLELKYNVIGDNGVAALAEGIKHLTSLQTLHLSRNRIGDEGVAALAEGIKNLTSLQVLKLGNSKIGDDGVTALAEALKHLTSLQVLELNDNIIGDEGVAALAEGIKHLTLLQTLDLGNNRIGDDGVVPLTRGLKNLTSLKKLNLQGNKISDKEKSKLRKLTGLKYLWV